MTPAPTIQDAIARYEDVNSRLGQAQAVIGPDTQAVTDQQKKLDTVTATLTTDTAAVTAVQTERVTVLQALLVAVQAEIDAASAGRGSGPPSSQTP